MLGISAIGWTDEEEDQVLSANMGVFDILEIVPARIFAQNKSPTEMAKEYRETYGLWPYSAQALFFQSNVQSFEDSAAVSEHLLKVISLGSLMGIKRFVLGSPSLRKGSPSYLMHVLKRIESVLEANDAILCIEPIAKSYGGSYFFDVEEIVNQIDFYNMQRVKTMLDTNNAWLQGDSPSKIIKHYLPYIAHAHISDTDNGPLLNTYEHKRVKNILDTFDYDGAIVRELLHVNKNQHDYPLFRSIYA